MKWKISPFVECYNQLKNDVKVSAAEMVFWYMIMLLLCLFIGVFVQ